jgi:hypothetical protein
VRGRIRTAKPEVLKDEDLWDLETLTGLPIFRAFVGLWMFSDREARFEWRPRQLKSDVLPYWDGNFDAVLDALASKGFITRYTVDGRDYGHVTNLTKHQRFDHKEPVSVLPPPPPPGSAREKPGPSEEKPGPSSEGREGKGIGREGKGIGREGKGEGMEPAGASPGMPDVSGLEVVAPLAKLARFVPDAWEPKEQHRARCAEVQLPFDDVLKRFRKQEFNRAYSDWDRRFELWIDDQKVQAETERFRARASPRRHGSRQPNAGLTGFENAKES